MLSASVVLAVVAFTAFHANRIRSGAMAVSVVALIAAAVCAVAFYAEPLLTRIQDEAGSGTTDRLLVYRDVLRMIGSRLLFGQGAGSFEDLYPAYHLSAPSFAIWNAAHDTYLQLVAELGLPVALVLLFGVSLSLIFVAREVWRAPSSLGIAAVAAAAGVALQSVFDFGLQIQAVGLTIAILLGDALGDAMQKHSGHATSEEHAPVLETAFSIERVRVVNGSGAPAGG
jgi:O-antigen ligase